MTESNELGKYDTEIRRLYLEERLSDSEVAAALPINTTASGISSYRTRHGIKGHRRGAKSSLDPHRDEITRLYVEGLLTDEQIAQKFEVTNEAVRRARIRWGVATDRRKKGGRYSMDARYERIKDELPRVWEASKRMHSKQNRMVPSSERVAEHYGVSFTTAQKWLRRAGLLGDRPSVEREGLRAKGLFDQGWSVPRIAHEIGQKEDSVRNWLNAQGCDLSGHVGRMSHEEKLAWRGSISDAKAADEDSNRRHPYGEHLLGSKYEVIAVTQFDRVGLPWRPYSRLEDGVLDYERDDGHVSRYAPDLVVSLGGVDINVEIKGLYAALDQVKVRRWRKEKGKLALMQRVDILELEHAADAVEAFDTVRACCYNDPEIKTVEWRR